MSDEIRINRTVQQPAAPQVPQDQGDDGQPESSKTPWIVLGAVVVILVVVGVLFRDKLFGAKSGSKTGATVAKASYQAVFLTNGQVYFGKISNTEENYVTLKDIYYLQVVQPPLQGSNQSATGAQPAPQPQISLVKLGNELHGPVDEMHISRAQMLFYEDLKDDGQVVKAILNDKNTQK